MQTTELFNLFKRLNNEPIQYCHWKSNAHLSKSFDSKTDFDILISNSDGTKFSNFAQANNLKRRYSTADKLYPGMEDYIGFDQSTGKIFHLHVHFKLVIGKQKQKNYRIPIEDQILNTAIWDKDFPIKIIQPELELALLIIRSLIKINFGLKNFVKHTLGRSIFPSGIREEYSFLTGRFNKKIFIDYIDRIFFEQSMLFKEIIEQNISEFSYFQLLKFQKRFEKSLLPFRLFSNRALKSEIKTRRLSGKNSRTWLGQGGISIAFLGVDGSGKSSMVSEIERWLGWKLSVKSIYMGLPKQHKFYNTLIFFEKTLKKLKINLLGSRLEFLKWVYAANVRYRNYRVSEMLKNQGTIVIFDRFPMKEFWDMDEPMDGPRIKENHRWKDREYDFYNKIKDPDYIFILKVDEAVAIDRKKEHNNEQKRLAIKKKVMAIEKLNKTDHKNTFLINTMNGKKNTLLKLKKILWEHL